MASHEEKSSFHLERPDTPANKKHVEMRIVKNNSISRLIAWCGAFAFPCSLIFGSTFKRSKIIYPKKSRDGDSDLDVGGFGESTTRDADGKGRQMEGLQLLLQSSSSDTISRPCHRTSKTLVKYTSIEDSEDDQNQHLTTEPILEKKEDENIVVIIYEEEEYPDSEKSIENKIKNYVESSKVAQSFSSRSAFDETWLAEWIYKPSTSSSSSSSSSEETSSSEILLQEIDELDDKNIDIVIYIDDDDENGEDKQAHMV